MTKMEKKNSTHFVSQKDFFRLMILLMKFIYLVGEITLDTILHWETLKIHGWLASNLNFLVSEIKQKYLFKAKCIESVLTAETSLVNLHQDYITYLLS